MSESRVLETTTAAADFPTKSFLQDSWRKMLKNLLEKLEGDYFTVFFKGFS